MIVEILVLPALISIVTNVLLKTSVLLATKPLSSMSLKVSVKKLALMDSTQVERITFANLALVDVINVLIRISASLALKDFIFTQENVLEPVLVDSQLLVQTVLDALKITVIDANLKTQINVLNVATLS
jgi:hypothetical protein